MAKVKVIAKDETGREVPFFSKTLTKEFKGKEGKKYGISIEEPNKPVQFVGDYTVQGAVIPDPHNCAEHEHWDEATQQCVPDEIPHECPEGKHWDETTQQCIDNPPEELLYDSNTDIKWDEIQGDSLTVTDVYGEFKPNAKYFRMKASGNPRMILMKATKEMILEHGGDYGRAYVGACNYESRLEAEFKLTNASHNASFKLRNRHQFADVQSGASDKQRQGGQGSSFAVDSVDADCEIVHGTEISGPKSSLNPKLEINKYYKIRFSQFNKNGRIHIIDELDRDDGQGFKVVNEGDTAPPLQFFNKGEFETWSEFWIRGNMKGGGRMYFKNVKLYKLGV